MARDLSNVTGLHGPLISRRLTSRYKANVLFFVSIYDHMHNRVYVENIPGAPMCGYVKHTPVVSRSNCTQTNVQERYIFEKIQPTDSFVGGIESASLAFQAYQGANNNNNDLREFVKQLVNN